MTQIFVALVLALAMTAAPTARAADQTILGFQLMVKSPSTPEKRKVVVKAKEVGSPDTIVGNPTAGGATLRVAANGGTPSAQSFVLPVGTSALTGRPFWSGDAVRGFKYRDSAGENGPVKAVQLKKSGSGLFQVKAIAVGKLGAIAVAPPNLGTDGCVRLEVGGGSDTYHVRFGADGQVTNDGAKQFKVVKPTVEGTCPPPTITTTTTTTTSASTTSTTTIPLPGCGTPFMCDGTCPDNRPCVLRGGPFDYYCACGGCSDSPFPTCGGPCPTGQVCAPAGNFCDCVPSDHTCGVISGPPTCGGTCPTGEVCGSQNGGPCNCWPSDQTCFISQAPACGGTCPTGEVCGYSVASGCGCVTSDNNCAISQAPACGGTCPTGEVCGFNGAYPGCHCASPCDFSEAPTCGGACPSGQICGQRANTCECVTSDNTCAISQAPTCGGTCPSGQGVCRQPPGENLCYCTIP